MKQSAMNKKRAKWAEAAIVKFQAIVKGDREDALHDLLCDLMHWADTNKFDFEQTLDNARACYQEEIEED